MAGRLNELVDQLSNQIYQQEENLKNVSTPLNLVSLKTLKEQIDSLIRERENLDIHDYFNNQDFSIDHEDFQNH